MSDEWETPQWLFNELDDEFNFELDACASSENNKCNIWSSNFLTLTDNCFKTFMNPPYSNPKPFIEKAWQYSKNQLIVCLVKVDTSTQWWSTFWDYEQHKPKPGCEVRFLPKRLKYEVDGEPQSTAPFPSAVVIMDRRKHD